MCSDFHCCECCEFSLHLRDSCYYKINSTFLIVAYNRVVTISDFHKRIIVAKIILNKDIIAISR